MTPETLALCELLAARRDEFEVLLDRYRATNPMLFGSVARGTASAGSGIDILVETDPAEGNLLMRGSGLLEQARALLGRDDIDVSPAQLLDEPDRLVEQLRADAAVMSADTLMLTIPNQVGTQYYLHVLESFAKYVAPELGWEPADAASTP
ncbi:nucleotidyltransferase family protein [Flaviflexus massiliensis]|uniref:nucleotidyltransferase family protein n=1 Tax=Flaviflexus massiliensis TaxID=1522309 RepID=UPI0009EB0B9C|nr:nucleotidyltransferase domain-containing protein [Flaviflexus massiliensis]